MSVLDFFVIVLVVSATILCVYLIFTLKKLVAQINELQKDVRELVNNTIPVLKNLNEVTIKANRIVSSAEDYWDSIERSIENVRYKFSKLTNITRFDGADFPARNFLQNIKAVAKGATAFWQEFRR